MIDQVTLLLLSYFFHSYAITAEGISSGPFLLTRISPFVMKMNQVTLAIAFFSLGPVITTLGVNWSQLKCKTANDLDHCYLFALGSLYKLTNER